MGTPLKCIQIYCVSPETVRSMLIDPDYISARASATGALTVTHVRTDGDNGDIDLVIVRTLPADMPSYARSIVGETLTVTEHQLWPALVAQSCSARFDVGFSAPLAFVGTVELKFDGSATSVITEGEFKAAIPFVGGKVERLALEQTERYLRKEEQFATKWLERAPDSL